MPSTLLDQYRAKLQAQASAQPYASAAVTGAHLAPGRAPAPSPVMAAPGVVPAQYLPSPGFRPQASMQPHGYPGAAPYGVPQGAPGFHPQANAYGQPQYAQPGAPTYGQPQYAQPGAPQGGYPQAGVPGVAPGMSMPQAFAGYGYFGGAPAGGFGPQNAGPGFQPQAGFGGAPGFAPGPFGAPSPYGDFTRIGGEAPGIAQARMQGYGMGVPQLQHFAHRAQEGLFDPSGTLNPYAYGGQEWRNGLQQAVPDPTRRLFNASGQINAQDRKDALQQIAHFLHTSARSAGLIRQQRVAESQAERLEKARTLTAAIRDPEGFAILGQQLLLPIKSIIDYEGWARKVFRVRALQQGEYFRIAKDVRSTAWVIGQDGQGVESRLYGRYVTPSEFKIGSFPTIDVEEIYQMNFDVLDRAQQTARQEIELEEDKRARALIDVAARTVNTPVSFTTLGIGAFEDIRYQIERHRLQVAKFLINRAELSDIVQTMSTQVDPVTERELILAGYIGSVLNCVIMTTAGTGVEEVVPAGTVYAVTDQDYLGEMGIRLELFSEPFTMFAQRRLARGYAFGEIIGYVIPEPRSCAVGQK